MNEPDTVYVTTVGTYSFKFNSLKNTICKYKNVTLYQLLHRNFILWLTSIRCVNVNSNRRKEKARVLTINPEVLPRQLFNFLLFLRDADDARYAKVNSAVLNRISSDQHSICCVWPIQFHIFLFSVILGYVSTCIRGIIISTVSANNKWITTLPPCN